MKINKGHDIPKLSHFGFWDVDLHNLNFDKYASFVIIRVMERGTSEDMQEVIRYYGEKKVKQCLTSAPFLKSTAVEAGKELLNLKNEDFKCYTNTPLTRNFSMY